MLGCGSPDVDNPGGVVIEGRWVGELESGSLASGSTEVMVEIERARAGQPIVARVTFGAGQPPTAPTDPDVGWPSGIDPLTGSVPVADGFVYEARGGTLPAAGRVRIQLGITDLWEPWCELQTPYVITAGTEDALCLPNRPWTARTAPETVCVLDADEAGNPETPVDCLKLTLCRRAQVCDCTASGGCVPSTTGVTLSLELAVNGNEAVGALTFSVEGTTTAGTARVRLFRT